jgi:hypothetical protein
MACTCAFDGQCSALSHRLKTQGSFSNGYIGALGMVSVHVVTEVSGLCSTSSMLCAAAGVAGDGVLRGGHPQGAATLLPY